MVGLKDVKDAIRNTSLVRASYTRIVRGSYRTGRLALLYEARTTAGTSLVAPAGRLRASYSGTSLVYEALLVYEPYTRLVRRPVCVVSQCLWNENHYSALARTAEWIAMR